MRLFRGLIACYLALCFAFAGAVGVSPFLHAWIEHSGKVSPHTHLVTSYGVEVVLYYDNDQPADALRHALESSRPHVLQISTKSEGHLDGLFVHDYKPFRLPDLSFLWRSLDTFFHLLEGSRPPSSGPSPFSNGPRHHHNSLPQLLASGLAEPNLHLPLLLYDPVLLNFRALPTPSPLHVRDWDAQTASRGPPFARS